MSEGAKGAVLPRVMGETQSYFFYNGAINRTMGRELKWKH